jgi:O-antigen/teichoic acid export membrane protein
VQFKKFNTKTNKILTGQVLSALLSFIAIVILARYCGPTIFGYCTIVILVLSVVLDLIDFGGVSWSARELAAGRISNEQYLYIACASFKNKSLLVILSPLWLLLSPDEGKIVVLLVLYPALWNFTNYVQQFLIVKNQIDFAIKLQIGERFIWLTAIPMTLLDYNPYATFVFPILGGLTFHVCIGYFRLIKKNKLRLDNNLKRKAIYRRSFHLGITSFLSDVGNLDTYLVAKFISISDSGSYALVTRIRNPLLIVFQAISTKQRPTLAMKNKNQIQKIISEDLKAIVLGSILIVALAFFMLFFANSIFGNEYKNLQIIMFLGIISQLPAGASFMAANYLNAVGEEKYVAAVSTISVPIALLTVALFGFLHGILAVCWSVLFVNLMIMLIYLKKSIRSFRML